MMASERANWHKHAEVMSCDVWDLLVNRTDCFGQWKGDRWITQKNRSLSLGILRDHFRGEEVIGIMAASQAGTCRFVAFDIDAHDGDHETARNYSQAICDVLNEYHIPFLDEDSDGRGGRHIWLVFDKPMEYCNVLQFAEGVLEEAGLPKDVEGFPKGSPSPTTPYGGGLIRLPGKHPRHEHWSGLSINPLESDSSSESELPLRWNTVCCEILLGLSWMDAQKSTEEDTGEQKTTKEDTGRHKRTEEHTRPDLSTPLCSSVQWLIDQAIRASQPTQERHRNKRLFDLARRLTSIEEVANCCQTTLKQIVRSWHQQALSVIATRSFDETWSDFIRGWLNVKHPHPMVVEHYAMEARKIEDPGMCKAYDSESVRVLIKICLLLSDNSSDGVFYLSCRSAARTLGACHKSAANWLNMLVFDGVLILEEKGDHKGRASRYSIGQV